MFGLFGKKCEYCKTKIENGGEVKADIKAPNSMGTNQKTFCSDDHAKEYQKEVDAYAKRPREKSGGCCG